MYNIQPQDNIVITGDAQNYDDITAIPMMLLNFKNVRAICITNGAWTNIGAAIEILNNIVLAVLKRDEVRVYRGSAKSSADELYNTLGIFNNIINQDEQVNIDNMYGARSYVTNIVSILEEKFGIEIDIGQMSKVAGDRDDFYQYAQSLPNLVIVSLGTMTDVAPIAANAKAIIQQGGRFYDPNRPISLPKVNPGASSNLYLDPIAAKASLVANSENIWWVFSDAVVDVRTTQETVNRLLTIKTNNPMYNAFIYALAMYYQGMVNMGINLPISDATLPIILKHPELVTNVEVRSIDIVDSVMHSYTETPTEIITTISYDKRIGSMIDGPYPTNLVLNVNNTDGQMTFYFYQMLRHHFTNLPTPPSPPSPPPLPPLLPFPGEGGHGIIGVTLIESNLSANIISTTINGQTNSQVEYSFN